MLFANNKKIVASLITAAALFAACEKEAEPTLLTQPPAGGAFVKVIHAAPAFGSVFNVKDTFHLYLGAVKVNGPLLTYGGAFPSRTANGYAQVPAGTAAVKFFFPGVAKPDSAELFTMQQNVQAGKYYSLIVTDSVRTAKDSARIWLEDNFETPAPNQFSLRFVHGVMNDTAGKSIDVYSARRNGNIVSGFKPGQASGFTGYAYNGLISDTLIVRRTGTGQELARLNNISSFGNQRVYTLVYRGDGNVSGTGVKARALTFYLNK